MCGNPSPVNGRGAGERAIAVNGRGPGERAIAVNGKTPGEMTGGLRKMLFIEWI
jgi:hypothetical protein